MWVVGVLRKANATAINQLFRTGEMMVLEGWESSCFIDSHV